MLRSTSSWYRTKVDHKTNIPTKFQENQITASRSNRRRKKFSHPASSPCLEIQQRSRFTSLELLYTWRMRSRRRAISGRPMRSYGIAGSFPVEKQSISGQSDLKRLKNVDFRVFSCYLSPETGHTTTSGRTQRPPNGSASNASGPDRFRSKITEISSK